MNNGDDLPRGQPSDNTRVNTTLKTEIPQTYTPQQYYGQDQTIRAEQSRMDDFREKRAQGNSFIKSGISAFEPKFHSEKACNLWNNTQPYRMAALAALPFDEGYLITKGICAIGKGVKAASPMIKKAGNSIVDNILINTDVRIAPKLRERIAKGRVVEPKGSYLDTGGYKKVYNRSDKHVQKNTFVEGELGNSGKEYREQFTEPIFLQDRVIGYNNGGNTRTQTLSKLPVSVQKKVTPLANLPEKEGKVGLQKVHESLIKSGGKPESVYNSADDIFGYLPKYTKGNKRMGDVKIENTGIDNKGKLRIFDYKFKPIDSNSPINMSDISSLLRNNKFNLGF